MFERVSQELRCQYTLGYVARNLRRDGVWRRINVHTARANLIVTPRPVPRPQGRDQARLKKG